MEISSTTSRYRNSRIVTHVDVLTHCVCKSKKFVIYIFSKHGNVLVFFETPYSYVVCALEKCKLVYNS